MLSRFSKLSGISFLSNKNTSRELIDKTITEIRNLGRSTDNNSDDITFKITRILSLMSKYSESLHIQRVSCHALSNLAMQVVVARWILRKGGFKLIAKALHKFIDDSKLCWLGSSAIWNLARPPSNRSIIGKEGVILMLKVLEKHQNKEKVTNTTIGALSNLSLDENLKNVIAEKKNVNLILCVLEKYIKEHSSSVLTSGAGLLANLAVSDMHATLLVEECSLPLLLHLLEWNKDNDSKNMDETLYRNACAALNNMVSAEDFLDNFLSYKGIEHVFNFLERNNNELYTNLLENCLINLDIDISTPTTSIHASAMHGRLEILQLLIRNNPFTDLNSVDSKNMTCLDYALSMGHSEVVGFLIKCGANKYEASYIDGNENKKQSKELRNVINEAKSTLQFVRNKHIKAIYEALPYVPKELCSIVVSYNSNIDMLGAMDCYL